MPGKHTIDDIARLAGVSKATISRVLNHKPDVDPTTRERILRIVEEVGFVPSVTATGLASGRNHLVGALVPSFTWPFIADVIRGIAEAISETPYELVLYSIKDRLREKDTSDVIDSILAAKLTAGLLAIFPGSLSHYLVRLHKQGFPVVLVDDQRPPTSTPWVGADNYHGAHMAARHLIDLGHRRIAHIAGPHQHLCSQERCQGYTDALQEAGITVDSRLIVEGNFTTKGGRVAANALLTLPPEARPTAIFAANDQTAYGVMAAAEEHGLHIPRDIALVGFDDISSAAHVRPALTTVRQPFAEMGQHATELLLSMLHSSQHSTHHASSTRASTGRSPSAPASSTVDAAITFSENEPVRIQLPTRLVVRASCGSPTPTPDLSLSTPEAFT
jgi:LacI family transcriptional regulator